MRTLAATIIGVAVLGTVGLQEVEALNLHVREVRREMRANGLAVIYEVENASVDPWDLTRVETHVFDGNGRRIGLFRPLPTRTRLERGDVEFVQAWIPSPLLAEGRYLELKLFLTEGFPFPVAGRPVKHLSYTSILESRATPPPLRQSRGALRVESAGMVERPGGPRVLLLRLTNISRHTLSEVLLRVGVRGPEGILTRLEVPVTPSRLLAGAEAYPMVSLPPEIVRRATGISLEAVYWMQGGRKTLRYVEEVEVHGGRVRPTTGAVLQIAD